MFWSSKKETIIIWDTPFKESRNLILYSLVENKNGKLTLLFEDKTNTKYTIIFKRPQAYRRILEEYQTARYNVEQIKKPHRSFIVENSKWIFNLQTTEPLFKEFEKNVKQYMIFTSDEIIDVLSNIEPKIKTNRRNSR